MRRILKWPGDVSAEVGISETLLKQGRAMGDAPKLYAASERNLVTFDTDVEDWIRAKAVPVTYKCRPATRGAAVDEARG